MPLIRVDMLKGKDAAFKKTLLESIHEGLVRSFGIEDWDRFARVCEYDADSFEKPDFKSGDFMIIELTIFPGRSNEAKKDAIESITSLISGNLGIRPEDIFIVINEPPLQNWGMGGNQKGSPEGDT